MSHNLNERGIALKKQILKNEIARANRALSYIEHASIIDEISNDRFHLLTIYSLLVNDSYDEILNYDDSGIFFESTYFAFKKVHSHVAKFLGVTK
jgi:hypothetical protein